MYNNYYVNGVILVPNVVAKGEKATVKYKGLLYNSGADSVYMHVGYGESWNNASTIPMQNTGDGFEAEVTLNSHDKLSMAFKDSAGHWDNNSSRNYSFEVLEK